MNSTGARTEDEAKRLSGLLSELARKPQAVRNLNTWVFDDPRVGLSRSESGCRDSAHPVQVTRVTASSLDSLAVRRIKSLEFLDAGADRPEIPGAFRQTVGAIE